MMRRSQKQLNETSKLSSKRSKPQLWKSEDISKLLYSICIYAAFGLFLQKGQVFRPDVIQGDNSPLSVSPAGQFAFTDFRMLKMFLSAVFTSQLVMALLAVTSARWFAVEDKYLKGHHERGLYAATIGASILGIGMALSGACPGTISAQLGSGVNSATYTIVGGLLGGLMYSYIQPHCQPLYGLRRPSEPALHRAANVSYAKAGVISAALILTIVVILHYFLPARIPFATVIDEGFSAPAWPPYIAGIGIGLLEFPSIILLQIPLGSSTNVVAMLSFLNVIPIVNYIIPDNSEIASLNFPSPKAVIKIASFVASIGGAFVSASLSSSLGTSSSLEDSFVHSMLSYKIQAFIGGVLLILGARIAGGCTSGHGISGFGMLIFNSIAAVPAMFLSAIATIHVMKLSSTPSDN